MEFHFWCVIQSGGKRKKSPSNGTSPLPEKAAKVDGGVRRSSRHRTMRGEKMFTVSARQTLWDLKLQVGVTIETSAAFK